MIFQWIAHSGTDFEVSLPDDNTAMFDRENSSEHLFIDCCRSLWWERNVTRGWFQVRDDRFREGEPEEPPPRKVSSWGTEVDNHNHKEDRCYKTITITKKIAVIRNAISTLSLLFVAAENGAVDVCRYLLARSKFSSFFHKNFIMILIWSLFLVILSRISVCHPGLVSRLTSRPTTVSAHFLRLRSETF